MDMIARIIAIIVEVIILAAITYAVLNGVRLAILDMGIKPRYDRFITVTIVALGFILVVFFIAHLTAFYP
ncbi:MAG: hypothetical protein A2Z29_09465 [Chloroflexi bacterium RBG_16_56_11]|nr:MAG: hypothetical protein A2Z29_09465 [Chloroflexi bacterium RBG_16_56_11]